MKTSLPHASKAALFLQAFPCHFSQFSPVEGTELACPTEAVYPLPYREKVVGHSTFSKTETGGLQKGKQQKPKTPSETPLPPLKGKPIFPKG